MLNMHMAQAVGADMDDDFFDDQRATTYEPNQDVIEHRFRRLYPHVNTKKTPLPEYWNPHDVFPSLRLSHSNLRVKYDGLPNPNKSNKDAASVRAAHPIPTLCGIYYFEVHIISSDGYMGVGLCEKTVSLNRLPGWDKNSYGYHGDDGNFFSSSGQGTAYGPTFGTNDVVGCGINFARKTIFFTKNGEKLGEPLGKYDKLENLYPTVGLQTPKGIVDVNFGQKPFTYDIMKEVQAFRNLVVSSIKRVELPPMKPTWLNNIVLSWLSCEGHSKTLAAFAKEANLHVEEDEANIEARKEISRLIYARRASAACHRIDDLYPGLLQKCPELELDLRAQRFVESAAALAEIRPQSMSANGFTVPQLIIPSNGSNSAPCTSRVPQGSVPHSSPPPAVSSTVKQTYNPHKRRSSGSHVESPEKEKSIEDSEAPAVRRTPIQSPPTSLSTSPGVTTRRRKAELALAAATSTQMEIDDQGEGGSGEGTSSSTHGAPFTPLLSEGNKAAKNGTSNGKAVEEKKRKEEDESATTIVDEQNDGMDVTTAEEEDQEERAGYTAQEQAEYEPFQAIIEEGAQLRDIGIRNGIHPQLKHVIEMALDAPLCKYEDEFDSMEIFGENRLRKLVRKVHGAILEYLGKKAESKLGRLERITREKKVGMMKAGHALGVFIDYDQMILARETANYREKQNSALRAKKHQLSYSSPHYTDEEDEDDEEEEEEDEEDDEYDAEEDEEEGEGEGEGRDSPNYQLHMSREMAAGGSSGSRPTPGGFLATHNREDCQPPPSIERTEAMRRLMAGFAAHHHLFDDDMEDEEEPSP